MCGRCRTWTCDFSHVKRAFYHWTNRPEKIIYFETEKNTSWFLGLTSTERVFGITTSSISSIGISPNNTRSPNTILKSQFSRSNIRNKFRRAIYRSNFFWTNHIQLQLNTYVFRNTLMQCSSISQCFNLYWLQFRKFGDSSEVTCYLLSTYHYNITK